MGRKNRTSGKSNCDTEWEATQGVATFDRKGRLIEGAEREDVVLLL